MIILIIGLGSIAEKHVDAIYALKLEVTIYALRGKSARKSYRDVINISSVSEIQNKIDFIVVSNITSAHEATIMSVLELQCPIFIEKPVLSDLGNVSVISLKLKEKSILTYVACNLRFHSGLQFLKKYLDEKKPRINEVNIYCGSYLPGWRPGTDYRNSYSANFDKGGGVHLDLIHELDYCTWLFGFPERVTSIKRDVSSLSINAIDSAKFMAKYTRIAKLGSASITDYELLEKEYIELEGWNESTRGCRSFDMLPVNAKKYIKIISELVNTPVTLLSTSPEREDTILFSNPFKK